MESLGGLDGFQVDIDPTLSGSQRKTGEGGKIGL
jgi:hypothetical protein